MARRRGPSLTREQVVQAAIELVRAEGAEALRVSRVARALGIQPPSIYNHVGSGDELAWAAVIEGNRQILEAFKDAVRGVVDPRDQLTALAHTARRWALENGGLYALMAKIEPDNDNPQFAPLMRDMLDLFARPFAQLGVPATEVVHAVRSIRAAMHGFVLLEGTGQFQLEEAPRKSYDWLIETVIRGLDPGP